MLKVEFASWKFTSVIEFDVDTILGVALEFYKNGELSKFVSAVDGLLRMGYIRNGLTTLTVVMVVVSNDLYGHKKRNLETEKYRIVVTN